MHYKRYIINVLASLFSSLVIVAIFCWFVNPFGIFSSPDIQGFNKTKPKKILRDRLSKVYEVNQKNPEVIILGSSRALLVPAEHKVLGAMPGYNLALTSSTTYEQYRMFQHAQTIRPLKVVILGLDEKFTEGARPDFSEDRLAVGSDGLPNRALWLSLVKDTFLSLVSYDALKSSFATINKQLNVPESEFSRESMRLRVQRAGGHRLMLKQAESRVVLTGKAVDNPSCENGTASQVKPMPVSKYFLAMLDLAYENNIQMYLYYTPVHARFYEAHCLIGNWPDIENLKRSVVKVVEERAKRYKQVPFPVWDFTGYNSITTEAIPEYGDTETLMRWYWESVHATEEVGSLVLDRMFGLNDDAPKDFGVLITTKNIEQHLKNIHKARARYAVSNPGDIAEVRSLAHQE